MGKDQEGKQIWTRIGAVWPNKSGQGLHLTWDSRPWGAGEDLWGHDRLTAVSSSALDHGGT